MTWTEIISAILGLACVFLAGRNSKYNFYVGYVYCAFLTLLFWHQSLWSAVALQPVSLIINACGHYRWTHPKDEERSAKDRKKLRVGRITKEQWPGLVLILCVFAAAWAMFLDKYTSDPLPWLDSFVLWLTLFAQLLSAWKCWECWIVWLVVNVANMALYFSAGLYIMPIVSALYLANGIWSLITWRRMYKKNE